MSTASEARLPWTRASTLASPGATPRTVPSFDTRAMAVSELQKVNLADGDEVALPVVGRGEDRLLLADAERHGFGRDLDLGDGLGCASRSEPAASERHATIARPQAANRTPSARRSAAGRRDITGDCVQERGKAGVIIAHGGRGRIGPSRRWRRRTRSPMAQSWLLA